MPVIKLTSTATSNRHCPGIIIVSILSSETGIGQDEKTQNPE